MSTDRNSSSNRSEMMKIQTVNNADNWEELMCEECGKTDAWELADEEDGQTAFVCECGETCSYVRDGQWRDIED